MASRKRPHLETRVRGKEDVSSRAKEALPGGAFAKTAPRPKSIEDFEAALTRAESGGADVVQVWMDFALWAKRLPGKEQLSILRRACRSLAGEKRHAQDIRQLRLWVMLADKEPRPADIFKHLEARGIGTHHALLFEAWAHHLEVKHDFEGAADAYRRGLASLAQPQARLRARRADFDERMRQRAKRTPSRTRDSFSTPPRDSRPWRLSHFRAIKTSLKKPSKLSMLRTRTPRKRSHEEAWRSFPVNPRSHKESPKRETQSTGARPEVDTRSRLTCRKQVAVERPAKLAVAMFSEKSDMQAIPKTQIEGQKADKKAHPVQQKAMTEASQVSTKEAQRTSAQRVQDDSVQVLPKAKPQKEPRRSLLSWLVPFGGFFRREEEEDYLEDCEEESIMEDDEMDELLQSPPEAKRRRLMGWLPW